MRSYIAVDSTIYLACIVLNAVLVWSLLNQRTGNHVSYHASGASGIFWILIAVHTCKVGVDEHFDAESIIGIEY
jgi:hypothetical protein